MSAGNPRGIVSRLKDRARRVVQRIRGQRPVHFLHHKHHMWKTNFGITVDWWDYVFGTSLSGRTFRRGPVRGSARWPASLPGSRGPAPPRYGSDAQ